MIPGLLAVTVLGLLGSSLTLFSSAHSKNLALVLLAAVSLIEELNMLVVGTVLPNLLENAVSSGSPNVTHASPDNLVVQGSNLISGICNSGAFIQHTFGIALFPASASIAIELYTSLIADAESPKRLWRFAGYAVITLIVPFTQTFVLLELLSTKFVSSI
jgi:hypothetical protein